MQKKRRSLFFKAVLLAFAMFFLDIGMIIFSSYSLNITGFSINDLLSLKSLSLSLNFKLFLVLQCIFTIFILIYTKQKDRYIDATDLPMNIALESSKNKTDLDLLYDLLRDKKEINLSAIMRTFKISKELALEWGRILESGNLAILSYPGFGEPILKINEGIIKPLNNEKSRTISNDSHTIKREIDSKSLKKGA